MWKNILLSTTLINAIKFFNRHDVEGWPIRVPEVQHLVLAPEVRLLEDGPAAVAGNVDVKNVAVLESCLAELRVPLAIQRHRLKKVTNKFHRNSFSPNGLGAYSLKCTFPQISQWAILLSGDKDRNLSAVNNSNN